MEEKLLISIVTAAYNSEKTIAQTIESVLNQTYTNIEYIIIDGLSSDGTVSIADSYRDKFTEKGISYRVVSEKDRGIYDAMNKGIRMANGQLIGLLNSDDWYEPVCAEVVAETYLKEPFDMMYADLRMIKRDGSTGIKRAKLRDYVTTRDWNHPTTFLTKQIYGAYQYPNESVYDDLDMLLYMRSSHKKVVTVNRTLANYRLGGASNRKSLKDAKERMVVKYRIYRKYGYSRLYLLEAVLMETAKFILA